MPMPSLDLPSAATAPRCARRDNAVSAFVKMSCEGWFSRVATKPTPHDSWSNRESISEGREPPVDTAGSAQFLVPISNYKRVPFLAKSYFAKFAGFFRARARTPVKKPAEISKKRLEYLYTTSVF